MRGDTAVVTSTGTPPLFQVPEAEVLLQDEALEAPRSMMRVGDRLVLTDRRAVHVVDPATATLRSLGQTGEGPGEFGAIGSLGFAGDDRIAVHDVRRQRVIIYDLDGEFLEEPRTPISPPLVNPVQGSDPEHFLIRGGAAHWVRTGNVSLGSPLPAGLLRHELGADQAQVLERWDDRTFIEFPSGLIGSRELFPPTTRHAFSRDGRLARGTGVEPCVEVVHLGERARVNGAREGRRDAAEVLRICRDRPPVPVGPGIRNPDFGVIQDPATREGLEEVVRALERPEHLPLYDRLLFAENGDLWVRTPGEELADVHPFVLGRVWEARPRVQRWEVFGREGPLLHAVELPYAMSPWVVEEDRVFGLVQLATGELALGVAHLPDDPDRRDP